MTLTPEELETCEREIREYKSRRFTRDYTPADKFANECLNLIAEVRRLRKMNKEYWRRLHPLATGLVETTLAIGEEWE